MSIAAAPAGGRDLADKPIPTAAILIIVDHSVDDLALVIKQDKAIELALRLPAQKDSHESRPGEGDDEKGERELDGQGTHGESRASDEGRRVWVVISEQSLVYRSMAKR